MRYALATECYAKSYGATKFGSSVFSIFSLYMAQARWVWVENVGQNASSMKMWDNMLNYNKIKMGSYKK